tara:strand:+ start:16886 stop:18640 length:1755 start_codon:yes stop_codon:yes gene_type:complete
VSLLHFGLELLKRYPTLFVGNLLLSLLLMVIDAMTLVSIAPIVTLLTKSSGQDSMSPISASIIDALGADQSIEVFLSVFVILTILNSVLLITINYFTLRAQFIVRGDMMLKTAERIFLTSTNFVNQQRQGDFINTLTQEVARVADAFTALTRMMAPASQAVVLLSVPFYISWQVTCTSILAAFVLMVPLRIARKRGYLLGQRHTQNSNRFTTVLQESLGNIRLVSGFSKEQSTLERLTQAFNNVRDGSVKMQLLQSLVHSAYAPIGIIVVFITFLVSRHFGVELAEIAVILYAFNRLMGCFANLNQSKIQLITMYPSFEQVTKIHADAKAARLRFGNHPFKGLKNQIRFDRVSFFYDENGPALKEISVTIPVGSMVALVGISGSGKSTLADTLLGLQQPSEGRILIDDVPMNDLDINSYKARLGYVPQQTSLFHDTIRANIAWANEAASEEDIRAACRMANAETFIESLPDGFETIVGDRGVRLSGGQMQRIALARAFVRSPSILILDEATSALDSESEVAIQSAIESIAGKTTMLIIAHRLSTISRADNIIVLDAGRIVEQGDFKTLMTKGGTFARLVKLQQL